MTNAQHPSIQHLLQTLCPDGVPYATLGEVCKTLSAPKKLDKRDYLQHGEYPIIDQGQKFIIAYTDDATAIVPKGEYIIFGDHTREIKFVDFPFAQGADGVKILLAKEGITPKYLYYAMSNLQIPSRGYNRHWSIAKDLPIPLPPLPIQERIVEILDKFSRLSAELEAELELRKKQYDFYRNRLLSFDSNSDTNTTKHYHKGYYPLLVKYQTLGEIGTFYGGLSGKAKTDFENGNKKFISYINVYNNIALNINTTDMVKIAPNEKQNTIEYGDVLFTGSSETREECGFSSVLTTHTDEELYLNSFCFGFRLTDKSILLPDFMKHLFRSAPMRKQIIQTANGVTRHNISKAKMSQIKIPLPPLPEQERIVGILDKFETLVSDLSQGLPAEINLVQKQYEYYRNQLLTF